MSGVFSTRFPSCRWVLVLLLLSPLVGCGKGTGFVTGKVTYQDKPLPSGSVTFYGANGQTDSSSITAEGHYTIPRAPVGPVKVTVVTGLPPAGPPPVIKGPGGDKPAKHPGEGKTGAPAGTGSARHHVVLPRKYEDPEQSGLTFTVTGGKQTIDIPLK
jgi:hypothetical protein